MLEGVPGVDDGVKLTDENLPPSDKLAMPTSPSFDEDGETLQPVASREGERLRDSCLIRFVILLGAVLAVVVDGGPSLESSSASLSSEEEDATLEAPSLAKLLLFVALGVLLFRVRDESSGRSSVGEHKAPGGSSQP